MLSLENFSVSAGDIPIIHNFSYTFLSGKIYVIMGKNGSGKSTLAQAVMGAPVYSVTGSIILKGEDITTAEPHERAKKGIFLSFQTPIALQGVRLTQLLQVATGRPALEIHTQVQQLAQELHVDPHLIDRSLNENASGGERKKLEAIQAVCLDASVQIFDEIDTGVDVDALQAIGEFLRARATSDKTYIIITHYQRLLRYIKPDKVLVMAHGRLVKEGGSELAEHIEHAGYGSI